MSSLAEDEFNVVVSCGGDGTLNEVVNGALGKNITVAVLPLGTGSDFGKTIGIRSLGDFMNAMKAGKISAVDVMRVEFPNSRIRYFVNILEIGFGAMVMDFVNSHKYFGRHSFNIGVFSTLYKMRPFELLMEMDGEEHRLSTIEVIVANGRYFGGGMLASPSSNIDDGFLDVHILKPFSRISSAMRLRYLTDGSGYGFC